MTDVEVQDLFRRAVADDDAAAMREGLARHRWQQRWLPEMSGLTIASGQRRMYYRYYVSGALMRLNSKGQVTIPAALRERHGLHEGDEVDVIEDGNTLRIVQVKASPSRGQRLVRRMRGRASTTMSTDQLMELLRGE
jgi:AbrB family looped-hinge helix DNA binding protein